MGTHMVVDLHMATLTAYLMATLTTHLMDILMEVPPMDILLMGILMGPMVILVSRQAAFMGTTSLSTTPTWKVRLAKYSYCQS